jgi:hypothetical protein
MWRSCWRSFNIAGTVMDFPDKKRGIWLVAGECYIIIIIRRRRRNYDDNNNNNKCIYTLYSSPNTMV